MTNQQSGTVYIKKFIRTIYSIISMLMVYIQMIISMPYISNNELRYASCEM